MAKNRMSQSSENSQATFSKGLVNDLNGFTLPDSSWTYARNAINNSPTGDLGKLANEFSNIHCTYAAYTIIGNIHLTKARWLLFSANGKNSEIGIFDEDTCTYSRLVNDDCLGFNPSYLIKGIARSTFDCSYIAIWDDGLNVTRSMNIGAIPWVQECTDSNGASPGGCITCIDKLDVNGRKILDCDLIRLESFIKQPNVKLTKGASAGSILNGSYHVHIAYTVNEQKVTDYFSMSNVISMFDHDNVNGSIELALTNLDETFDQYMLVVVSTISEKTVARNLGLYSTNQNHVTIDYIDNTLVTVALNDLPIITPVPDKSDAVMQNGKYALRVGPTDKFDFNYQPLANQIQAFWQSVQYDKDYYKNGGTNVGHMRDEVYTYFIRWIYRTGDKSSSYHIPGKAAQNFTLPSDSSSAGSSVLENAVAPASVNIIETGYSPKVFEVYNTASITSQPNTTLSDGGVVLAEGKMGYHESSEFYPDKSPGVWNASANAWSDVQDDNFDLCGKPIRHHKFPENTITSGATSNASLTNHYSDGGQNIRVLGLKFKNVRPPVDNNGKLIPNIEGYEILRGSRNGNKTVLYKGMINNMWEYDLPKMTNGAGKKGLYANYPFNDLNADPFISVGKDPNPLNPLNPIATSWEQPLFGSELKGSLRNYVPNTAYKKNYFTFHSPDTQFVKPFLADDELKIYGALFGESVGKYSQVQNHPKHKFVKDLSFVAAIVAGIAYAVTKINGSKETTYGGSQQVSNDPIAGFSNSASLTLLGNIASTAAAITIQETLNTLMTGVGVLDGITGQGTTGVLSATQAAYLAAKTARDILAIVPGTTMETGSIDVVFKDQDQSPGLLRSFLAIAFGNPMLTSYMAEGGDALLKTILSVGKYHQFALDSKSLCLYENFNVPQQTNRRKKIELIKFLKGGINEVDSSFKVNHVYRKETVILKTTADVNNTHDSNSAIKDTSRLMIASAYPETSITYLGKDKEAFFEPLSMVASSHYVAVKNRLRNQYGKINNINQLPTQSFIIPYGQTETQSIFGGDTYIGRYSEKNTLYYFNQWLNGEQNGAEFNYFKQQMFEHVTYWMDTNPFGLNDFFRSIPYAFTIAVNASGEESKFQSFFDSLVTPSDKYTFDFLGSDNGKFLLKNAYMYLYNSGVREFFVESELNIDYRDYGSLEAEQHYPVLSDLNTMFHPNIIRADNYYKLDRSLSTPFLAFSKVSSGNLQDLSYNPLLSQSCYTKRPKRLLYSLPQETESKKDNWSIFLPYNYKDFSSEISGIKALDKTSALILFETAAPSIIPGTDTLRTGSNEEITIGTGTLFARDIQELGNSEKSFEYGACQSMLSIINTPAGVFWMNLNQGRIFNYAGGIKEISLKSNKFWLNQYLPYKLLEDFPEFKLIDNPVTGIGCQTAYDNEYGLVYFCKKDFVLKDEFKGPNAIMTVVYLGENNFLFGGVYEAKLGNPLYFNNASWTLSYDPKIEEFISFHDWHPDLIMSGKNTFITTKKNGLWRHNKTCQSFCNYYGVEYPFEVEFQINTKFQVSTLKSIEYYLENYIYDQNCNDRFLELDRNFDEVEIYNNEQVSGVLKLVKSPKNDIKSLLAFPKVTANFIEILYSKEEQKYKFNQFWDIVKDRGEFSTAKNVIWKTKANGYERILNILAVDYRKPELQRKKFRHYDNKVRLRKLVNANVQMLISLATSDSLNSPR